MINVILKSILITILCRIVIVLTYSNKFVTISKLNVTYDGDICFRNSQDLLRLEHNGPVIYSEVTSSWQSNFMLISEEYEDDPYDIFQNILYKFLFGDGYDNNDGSTHQNKHTNNTAAVKRNYSHFATGRSLRKAELFNNKSGVHLPIAEMMLPGHCVLNVTKDYMQTAVDAFAIFVKGDLEDIQGLPPDYVLNSARAISMLKISQEKLAVTWKVVKGPVNPMYVTYETLEKYRPLFKYLNGKDMARLDLTNVRILNYIGTHPDLNRHQVGLVASKYIKLNRFWSEPKYLNLMNNLLCGVPITFMREIPENTYLQLSQQVFYHTRACDPLQRKFYLGMMTRTQALGKSYSWNAQDVSRLGLLLAEVEGVDLGSIKPEALAGMTAQVMLAMRPENLLHLTEVQMRFIKRKPFNILSKKLKMYREQFISAGFVSRPVSSVVCLNLVILFIFKY